MTEWKIVIPSYGRVEILKKMTLATLQKYNIPPEKIYVFVADAEEEVKYREGLGNAVGHIIVAIKGLAEVRDFIFDYFEPDAKLVSFDDDVTGFIEFVTPKEGIVLNSLVDMINTGFEECEKSGAKFWGCYPMTNTFFMKNKVSYDFKFIIGSFWGCYNPGLNVRLSKANGGLGSEKEDYIRTILFWEMDKCIVRLNKYGIKTRTYKTPGGLQFGDRAGREWVAVKTLLERYPQYIRMNNKRKSKYPELSLIKQKVNVLN